MRFSIALALSVATASTVVASFHDSHHESVFERDLETIAAENPDYLEARQVFHEEGEWFDVGVMLARGEESDAGLVERDNGAVERWTDFPVERDVAGEWKLPTSYAEAKRTLAAAGSLAKRKLMPGTVRLTWYTGADLKNPACGDWRLGGKWHPTDQTYNAALTASWTGKTKPVCKSLIRVTTPKGKSVVVRVVDACASSAMSPVNSCTKGMKVVDLTKAAFKRLAPLEQGIIDKVKVEVLTVPKSHKWNKGDIKKWGPLNF